MSERIHNKKESVVLQILEFLKKSPIFNLSLGSKELFHSNFIAWLAIKYPVEMGIIFSGYINGIKLADRSLKRSLRECKNKDLTFFYEKEQMLIIENKVKSIPDIDQLHKYSEKHNSQKNYLLLSLLKPDFVDANNMFFISDSISWKFLSYGKLSELLRVELLEKINSEESHEKLYDKLIINDYIDFIENLSQLEQTLLIDWENDLFDFYSGKISEDINFRSLRIHDFFLKHKYNQIKYKIIDELQKVVGVKKNFEIMKNGYWKDGMVGQCYFEQHFTNSQGLVGFKFIIKKYKEGHPLALGLQLQGNSFRLVVECPDGNYALKVAKLLKNECLWFVFNEIEKYQNEIKIKGKGQKNKDSEFASFGGDFFYKYVNLDKINMSDLIQLMKYYYTYILENFDKINNILNQFK